MNVLTGLLNGLKSIFAQPERIDLDVPFILKDEAKQLGARWDPQRRVWFVMSNQKLSNFAQWIPGTDEHRIIYLDVPYDQKDLVRSLGASWDNERRAWFIPPGLSPHIFNQWRELDRPPQSHVESVIAQDDYITAKISRGSKYLLSREDGMMSSRTGVDTLEEAKEMASIALKDEAEVTLFDTETGAVWYGFEILELSD